MIQIIRVGTLRAYGATSHPKEVSMFSTRRNIAVAAVALIAVTGVALAQTMPPHQGMMGSGGPSTTMPHAGMHGSGAVPTMPGQDAFGAIQEIVQMLDADPKTDWSKVDLEGLRQHLIDMNAVTLKADATAKPIDGGIEVTVTGATGRTVAAIQRMVPADARQIEQTHLNGWSAKTETLPNGVLFTVTAGNAKEVQHIRGLGFIGILVSGAHHQPHHLAMAKGEFSHMH